MCKTVETHEALVQRGLPRRERLLVGFTLCDDREDILNRILERIGRSRNQRYRPVNMGAIRPLAGTAWVRSHMKAVRFLVHPEPQPLGLRDAGDDHSGARCCNQHRIRPGYRHPSPPHSPESTRVDRGFDGAASCSPLGESSHPNDSTQVRHHGGEIEVGTGCHAPIVGISAKADPGTTPYPWTTSPKHRPVQGGLGERFTRRSASSSDA